MRTTIFIISTFISIAILSACYKKDRKRVVGTYSGYERYVHIGPYGDTLRDTTYLQTLTIAQKNHKTFTVTKSTYPYSYEVNAYRLMRNDSVQKISIAFPEEIWKLKFNGVLLNGTFKEDNNWAGSHDHYYFEGAK